jgi:putative FmdB family regulatory protein
VPTYDYQCRSCGAVTEVIHPMSEDGPTVCDRCGGELRRVLYPAGIIFKGSGFYRTDSRSNGDTTAPKKAPAGDTSAGGATSSEGGGKPAEGGTSSQGAKPRSGSASETKKSGEASSSTSTDTSG